MIKASILSINVIGLLFFNLFLSDNIEITQNIPTSLAPGSEQEVVVTIHKGDVAGFAKLQFEVPSGISISSVENSGASFTFKDQKAKFIWMSLPGDSPITLKYNLVVGDDVTGAQTITGKFSYIADNERKTYDLDAATFEVSAGATADSGTDTDTATDTGTDETNVAAANASGTRTITSLGDGKYKVEVSINKEGITGFAKLQEMIPAGFTATSLETQSAVFTNVDQKAKFVWMSLPASNEVTVSYQLEQGDATGGSYEISGLFSYLLNDETQKAEISGQSTIEGEAVADNSDTSTTDENTDNTTDTDTSSDTDTETTADNSTNNDTDNTTDVDATTDTSTDTDNSTDVVQEAVCSRTITAQGSNYLVAVTINKGNIEGFAKLQEYMPEGFTAISGETQTAGFSTDGQKVKFVWMSLPAKEILTVSYVITPNEGVSGTFDVSGDFSYLVNNETQKTAILATGFNVEAAVVADNTDTNTDNTDSSNNNNTTDNVDNNDATDVDSTTDNSDNNDNTDTADNNDNSDNSDTSDNTDSASDVTGVPAPETGVTYRVQISAGHAAVSSNYFARHKSFNENVLVENHEGWIKYTVGSFKKYRQARDKREDVTNGFNFQGPFVTAYNDGTRITVQEALMISNQKWVQ